MDRYKKRLESIQEEGALTAGERAQFAAGQIEQCIPLLMENRGPLMGKPRSMPIYDVSRDDLRAAAKAYGYETVEYMPEGWLGLPGQAYLLGEAKGKLIVALEQQQGNQKILLVDHGTITRKQ